MHPAARLLGGLSANPEREPIASDRCQDRATVNPCGRRAFPAAREVNVPVIVGASEGERQFLGVRQIAATVKSLREEYDFPIYADHSHSLASAIKAAEAGFDSIVFDV